MARRKPVEKVCPYDDLRLLLDIPDEIWPILVASTAASEIKRLRRRIEMLTGVPYGISNRRRSERDQRTS